MILDHKMHTVMPYVIANYKFTIGRDRNITNNDANNDWFIVYSMLDTETFLICLT